MPILRLACGCLALIGLAIAAGALAGSFATAGEGRLDFASWEQEADIALGNKNPKAEPPEQPKPPEPLPAGTCQVCRGTGKYPCSTHARQIPAVIEGQAPPACCSGIGWVACPRCPKEQVKVNQDAFKQACEDVKTLTADLKKIEGAMKMKMPAIVTPCMSFVSDVNPKMCTTSAQHAYELLEKLERIFRCPQFRFTKGDNTYFYIFNQNTSYQRFLETVYKEEHPDADIELSKKALAFFHPKEPSRSYANFAKMKGQSSMDHHVVHTYGHFLLDRIGSFKRMPIWQDEGFAAWCEVQQLKQPETYCFAYEFKNVDLGSNRKKFLKDAMAKNKLTQLPTLDRMQLDGFELEHYFMSWSLITMLIERSPAKFLAFIEKEKGGDDTEAALTAAYGYDWKKLFEVWKRYVLAGN